MGLLQGTVSLTRFNLIQRPDEPDFEEARFMEIPPSSELREQVGFVPFELDQPYRVGHERFVFRVRIDQRKPDVTAVKERLRELVQSELEMTGAPFIGAKKKRQLRQLAEEELLMQTTPRTRILEGCIDGKVVYIASTAKNYLGIVVLLLRRIGVLVDFKAPWLDVGEIYMDSDVVQTNEPGQSVLGCHFLRELIGDPDVLIEPQAGSVRLQTADMKINLSGAVLKELHRYIEEGAEVLAAKMLMGGGEVTFRFDALSYRINGLKVEAGRHEHWTELLDERLEKIAAVWQALDDKYAALMSRGGAAGKASRA